MKKFLIIGNINACSYKEVFPYIKSNEMWVGVNEKGGTRKGNTLFFFSAEGDELLQVSAWWYTNLDHNKRHQQLELTQTYSPEKYPRYDNYDAIEVSRTKDIPYDYSGVMGVPISFLDKWCPEQFNILDARDYALNVEQREKNTQLIKDNDGTINGKAKYCRALIQRSNEMRPRPEINGKGTYSRILNENSKPLAPGEAVTYVDGKAKYARVFNEHSHHKPDILYGGVFNNPYINEKKKYQRILIIKKDESNNIL